MPDINEKIQLIFDDIDEKIEEYYEANDHKSIVELQLKKWDLLPEPKKIWDESFHIAESLIRKYQMLENEDKAIEWSLTIQECDPERADCGEKELILGKTFFEFGHYDESLKNLEIAFKKSKGREFDGEEPKYKKFLLNPETYMKKD